MVNREKGKLNEDVIAAYLRGKGYELKDRNWYCRWGELDIVARDGRELVFIEVKSRSGLLFGDLTESLNFRKKNALRRSIGFYLTEKNLSESWRLDLACVVRKKKSLEVVYYPYVPI